MSPGVKLYRRLASTPLFWRLVIFFGILAILWAPLALIVYGFGVLTGHSQIFSTVALILLYCCFISHAWFWGRWLHDWQRPLYIYGLVFSRSFLADALIALFFGVGLVVVLFGTELLLGWAILQPRFLSEPILEGLFVGLGIAFAEELLFRGWLLAELRTGVSLLGAIVWSGLIFAIAHFIKPLPDVLQTSPQFLGLLLLGLILATSRYLSFSRARFTSLGLPMGLHAGLVWGYYVVDVSDLVVVSGQVPEWVTGIYGNPLSGILGVTILGCLNVIAGLKLRSK
ncbi:MAG: CPBP family intramembrane metalloprotease [Leptolyngbya sp. SIO3F4]|nr:CPBP family intramembrane metalloprotease [Leptolyngbya sp. SIO3F4]